MANQPEQLYAVFRESWSDDQFIRLTLSKLRKGSEAATRVTIRPVTIKGKAQLSFVSQFPTKDITKNYPFAEAEKQIVGLLENTYLIANLFTTEKQIILELRRNGKASLRTKASKVTDDLPARNHDRKKKEWIADKRFLVELGILNSSGNVKKDKGDKYRQIKKFVEIVDGLVRQQSALEDRKPLRVVDSL